MEKQNNIEEVILEVMTEKRSELPKTKGQYIAYYFKDINFNLKEKGLLKDKSYREKYNALKRLVKRKKVGVIFPGLGSRNCLYYAKEK